MPLALRTLLVTVAPVAGSSRGERDRGCYSVDMSDRRTDYPPVGHPHDYLRGLVWFIILIVAILAVAFIVRLVLPG